MSRMSVSVVVVAYGRSPLLEECVHALLASTGVTVDVIVVDNGAEPLVLATLRQQAGVTVSGDGTNLGFGGGCNLGADIATGEFVAFVNPDAVVDPGALVALLAALEADAAVAIATARVVLYRRPDLINSAGGAIHFLGLGWAEAFEQPRSAATVARDVAAASGAAMVMRVADFKAVGGFTEELFLYHEDAELSLRCLLGGRRIRFVPGADVRHDYLFSRNADKYYYLERNRLVLVLTAYEARSLALLAPALVALEVGMLLLAVSQGWLGEKVAGWRWLLSHRRWLREHRRRVQSGRTVSDREVAGLLSSRFEGGQVAFSPLLRPADWLLGRYWRVVRRLL